MGSTSWLRGWVIGAVLACGLSVKIGLGAVLGRIYLRGGCPNSLLLWCTGVRISLGKCCTRKALDEQPVSTYLAYNGVGALVKKGFAADYVTTNATSSPDLGTVDGMRAIRAIRAANRVSHE